VDGSIDFTFCELREREVVNIVDGKRLGRVIDMAFTCCGQAVGIVVPGERRLLKNISGCENIFIPWKCVSKIGDDVILVNLGAASDGSLVLH
jgi:YlmC/YmxH family sporulation protein